MPFTPSEAGIHALARAVELLDASRKTKVIAPSVRADLRRLSVVMAVAALDTYMHRLIVARAYTHEQLPALLAKLDVPFERLLLQADVTKDAARRKPHKSRPRVSVKRQLRDRLLRETFQRYEDVGRALKMAGCRGNWQSIGQKLDPPLSPEQIKERLDRIVRRRNQIVHEGDYRRLDRPRNARRNSITRAEAAADILFIAALIEAIHEAM